MNVYYILAYITGGIMIALALFCFIFPKRKTSLVIKASIDGTCVVNNLFVLLATNNMVVLAGIITNAICLGRDILYNFRNKSKVLNCYAWPIAFALINGLSLIFTYKSPISIIPVIGSIISSLTLFANDQRIIKFGALTSTIFYLVYYSILLPGSDVLTLFSLISSCFSITGTSIGIGILFYKLHKEKYLVIANYHTHTYRCLHASGTDEEYVEAAIKKGLKILGFSDHIEITEDGFNNGEGKKQNITQNYFDSIRFLKEKYKDKINIFIGFESSYRNERSLTEMKELKKYKVDYFILGQHIYFDSKNNSHYVLEKDRTLNVEALDSYISLLKKGAESGLFSHIAHPDLFVCGLDEISDEIKAKMKEICLIAKQNHLPLEMNVGGLRRNRKIKYPNEEFFKIAKEVGNDVIIGVDAHAPEQIETADFDYALKMVKKYNLHLLTKLDFE